MRPEGKIRGDLIVASIPLKIFFLEEEAKENNSKPLKRNAGEEFSRLRTRHSRLLVNSKYGSKKEKQKEAERIWKVWL